MNSRSSEDDFDPSSLSALRRFMLFLIGYALLIILWGAFVRISGSGDGCGVHWPLCEGEWIPFGAEIQTWIEYFHRAKSGLFGILIFAFWFWSFRALPKTHMARGLANMVLFFMVVEALLGAALVKFGWVDQDASSARVLMHSAHFVNTLLLLASMSLFWVASYFKDPKWVVPTRSQANWVSVCLGLFLALGITGSWAALSTMLFQVTSLSDGLALDLSAESPWYVQFRFLHPLLAVILTGCLLFLIARLQHLLPLKRAWIGKVLTLLVFIQIAFGFSTLLALSPVWMKLVHLLLADLLWINFMFFIGWSFTRDLVQKLDAAKQKDGARIVSRFDLTRVGNA